MLKKLVSAGKKTVKKERNCVTHSANPKFINTSDKHHIIVLKTLFIQLFNHKGMTFIRGSLLKLTSHGILHYFCSADLSKGFVNRF